MPTPTPLLALAPRAALATIVLPARLDVHTVNWLIAETGTIIQRGASDVVFDGRDVRHTDHAGMRALEEACELVRAATAGCAVAASTALRVVFELAADGNLPAPEPTWIIEEAA
jgi:anti-anti-sigma regulatory factor